MPQPLQALNGADPSRLPLHFELRLLAEQLKLGSDPNLLVADERRIGPQSSHRCCCSCYS
jgi:hypothetical protein